MVQCIHKKPRVNDGRTPLPNPAKNDSKSPPTDKNQMNLDLHEKESSFKFFSWVLGASSIVSISHRCSKVANE